MNKSIIAVAAFMVGCVSVPLTKEEQDVRILRRSDPPTVCKELGQVLASGLMSITEEGRESDLRRATIKKGGNTVTIDRRDGDRTIYGTAFACP